ncbi:hypothetical protein HK102_011384 [Quaeritorhiza haematococci]|nr:hypothetical protein HK102_011384 [Quaeritorhiza haematococci]
MEARKIKLRHMGGTAVSMLLAPSRGVRDDIVRRGGKPKDHSKENYKRIKDLEQANRTKQQEKAVPPPQPFKMKQFENVPPKLQTKRPTSAPGTPPYGEECDPSRPPTASSIASSKSSDRRKNFIQLNAKQAITMQPKKVKPSESPQLPRKTKVGDVPK